MYTYGGEGLWSPTPPSLPTFYRLKKSTQPRSQAQIPQNYKIFRDSEVTEVY